MAKKRNLKHDINCICGELFAEAVAAALYGAKEHNDIVENVLYSIIVTRNDFVRRISHPEPGMPVQQYFKVLKEDFHKRVAEIEEQISGVA